METRVAALVTDPMAFGHESHLALIENFVDAIETGSPLRVTGEDALKTHTGLSMPILTLGVGRSKGGLRLSAIWQSNAERGRCCPRWHRQSYWAR